MRKILLMQSRRSKVRIVRTALNLSGKRTVSGLISEKLGQHRRSNMQQCMEPLRLKNREDDNIFIVVFLF
jgi:hypothetical protein